MINNKSTLARLRVLQGVSQAELGSHVGVTQVCISQIETGKRHGRKDVLEKIARALGIELTDLKLRGESR